MTILKAHSFDTRYKLKEGAGTDAIHDTNNYGYSVCVLKSDKNIEGVGLAFTLGYGNDLVCKAIDHLKHHVIGKDINELMSRFGEVYKNIVDDPRFRWLGPQKGVIHLATAAIVNACFDLWAKSKDVPLWKLLNDLTPEELAATLDFSYYEDILSKEDAIQLLREQALEKKERESILKIGYPGYDTSVGWLSYSDDKVRENIKKSIDNGFTSLKLKVGSPDPKRDLRRAHLLRELAGDEATLMFDANQQWNVNESINMCNRLNDLNPLWVEEPTHPDDINGHVKIKKETNTSLALGEHVPNKILFKNFLESGCMSFNQVDAVRVGGVSEFVLISLLSKKMSVPVVPHVGDMGQIHQHLVLFNHISVGHPALLLEHIPHLKSYFKYPVQIKEGRYMVPQEPGMSSDLLTY